VDLNEAIAVTGSPNTITDIAVDIQEGFLNTPLLGTMVSMRVPINDTTGKADHLLVLGQLTDLSTQNRWHENPALKNYIKKKGRLPNLTTVGDITTAKVQIIGAYRETEDGAYTKQRLSVPIGSGNPLFVVDRDTILTLMQKEQHYGFIGRTYGGRGDVPAPVYVRHFGPTEGGGTGEAYMGGFFGPTGSGKSVIAATMDVLWARNPELGMLILDPQSEFARNGFARGQQFSFNFHEMLRAATNGGFDAANDIIALDKIKLAGIPLFVALLHKRDFFKKVGLGDTKHKAAVSNVIDALELLAEDAGWRPYRRLDELEVQNPDVYQRIRDTIVNACAGTYASAAETKRRTEFTARWNDSQKQAIHATWNTVVDMFSDVDANGGAKQDLETIITDVMLAGRKVILDLDPELLELDDEFKLHIMQFVFKRIGAVAHRQYKRMDLANCLIIMDEAARFIPQQTDGDERKEMADYIARRVKELRKYRVGFQFITQNVSEIRKDIVKNLHYRVYAQGLSVGSDADIIKDFEGDEAFKMYGTLPEPRLSGTFSYMVCGMILALGTTGKPMFIEGFSSDAEIMAQNGITYEPRVAVVSQGDTDLLDGMPDFME
jgi:hypothetical protein